MLQFRGSAVTSGVGLPAHRELDNAVGLTATAGDVLGDTRAGKNSRHALVALLRQLVFGRIAGYEDANDADRLCRDPTMPRSVGDRATQGSAASASEMARFEAECLTRGEKLTALSELSCQWIDRAHSRRPPQVIALDMDSSVSPTYGEQESAAYNGHLPAPAITRWSCSTGSVIRSGAFVVPAMSKVRTAGRTF